MFFPPLSRKPEENYHNANGKFYSDYKRNRSKIEDDCKHRCVYCDILTDEMGGEGMQLDHFRPQAHFPELKSDPFNLVLSCPKCNVLKSDDWPANHNNNLTFENNVGYLDYFSHRIGNYLEVNDKGNICSIEHPTDYMIARMQLNRRSRVIVRYSRIMMKKREELSSSITVKMEDLHKKMMADTITKAEATELLEKLIDLKKRLDSL